MDEKELLEWFYYGEGRRLMNNSNTELNDGDYVVPIVPIHDEDSRENYKCKNCLRDNSRVSKSVYCSDKCKLDHWKKNVK